MHNLKTIFFGIAAIFLYSVLSPDSIISSKAFFTPNEAKLAVTGEFLTAAALKGKGAVKTNGVENTLPVQNSYLTSSFFDFDMVAVEKGFFYMDGNGSNRIKIYKALNDFPGLKGMSYYSRTDGVNSALILDSSRIQSQDDYINENPNDKNIPAKSASHFVIKDNRLGYLTFRSEFICSGENFVTIQTSTGTASRFGMKIFNPGDYRIYKILVYDRNLKGYFFYTVQFMKVRSGILSKFDLIKPESFCNRVRAENIHFLKSIGIDRSWQLAAFK